MDPLLLAGIVGGAGLLKHELIDRPREVRDLQMEALRAETYPHLGLAPGRPQLSSPFEAALTGALSGYALGQNIQAANLYQQLLQQMMMNQALSSPQMAPTTSVTKPRTLA